jgi:hypothetical protein
MPGPDLCNRTARAAITAEITKHEALTSEIDSATAPKKTPADPENILLILSRGKVGFFKKSVLPPRGAASGVRPSRRILLLISQSEARGGWHE